jgi:iron(III) transport system ATP-binding protein
MTDPIVLQLKSLSKTFSTTASPAVQQISFNLVQGELLGLLGPSGCGKTTLLRLIAGFERPDRGTIELAGRLVAGERCWAAPERRDVGMVFQDYALFPHLTVSQNVAFGLHQPQRRLSQQKIQLLTQEVIHRVGLTKLESRYPHELSGGQQQRVALARALAPQPALILLDEPLSNLDVQVRLHLRQEIRSILKAAGTSAIFVTHDQEEALSICDRVAILHQGHLEQLDTPNALYYAPASRFVAEFVTQANFIPAQPYQQGWKTEFGWFAANGVQPDLDTGEVMILQEDLVLEPDSGSDVIIRDREFLGRVYRYTVVAPSGQTLLALEATRHPLDVGISVRLSHR